MSDDMHLIRLVCSAVLLQCVAIYITACQYDLDSCCNLYLLQQKSRLKLMLAVQAVTGLTFFVFAIGVLLML